MKSKYGILCESVKRRMYYVRMCVEIGIPFLHTTYAFLKIGP